MENKLPAWDDLRVLLAVHRTGTFLAAGLELGLSTSTVARRIGALEKDLGRTLVHRTSQGAQLDGAALELVTLAQQFEQALAAQRRDTRSSFVGVVRVSVPEGFAVAVAAVAARFCRAHPETSIEVSSALRFVDLAAREADIGIRNRPSSSPVLIDKPFGTVHAGLFASEDYLARRLPGRVLGADDYADQDFILDDAQPDGGGPSRWLTDRGARRVPFRSNVFDARVRAASGGLGLVMMGFGDAHRHPDLVAVGLDVPLPSIAFLLTMHVELRKVARIKAFATALEAFAADHLADQDAAMARLQRRTA